MGEPESPLTRYIKDVLSAQKGLDLEDIGAFTDTSSAGAGSSPAKP